MNTYHLDTLDNMLHLGLLNQHTVDGGTALDDNNDVLLVHKDKDSLL